ADPGAPGVRRPAPTAAGHLLAASPGGAAAFAFPAQGGARTAANLGDPFPGFTGQVRTAAGDVNGDGVADSVFAAGPGGGPDVGLFLGATGARRSFFAHDVVFTAGLFVAVGDINGDGTTDVITGAGAGGSPDVRAFSGADLTGATVLADFLAYDPA